MSSPSKRKGSDWERQIVQMFKDAGLPAERAYASNGRALGCHETVDCIGAGLKIQAKIRKKMASFLQVPEACDMVAFRQDRGPALVLMPLSRLIELLREDSDE